MITILSGGTGGAKFIQGMASLVDARDIHVIVNTGDDLHWWGLHVSPDIDSVAYALSGNLSPERGWGFAGDTFECLSRMKTLGSPAWFQLGDRDLATHLRRTDLLRTGATLAEATADIASAMGIAAIVLPMTNDLVETRVVSTSGELSFQEYFVRERWQVPVHGVYFSGADRAKPAPGVVDAIRCAEAVFVAPSNPITSIGPILAIPGIRDALRNTNATTIAISPIIADAAVSGPAAELMRSAGLPVSCVGVAEAYKDFLDVLVIDDADAHRTKDVDSVGVHARVAATMMYSDREKMALAQAALGCVEQRRRKGA